VDVAEWRVGRKLGRTLYDGEVFVGLMETRELAEQVVEAMNGRERSPKPLADSPFEDPPGGKCPGCGCPWKWHQHGRCAGDFMCCTCTQQPPSDP
jgi:hypothetical protein